MDKSVIKLENDLKIMKEATNKEELLLTYFNISSTYSKDSNLLQKKLKKVFISVFNDLEIKTAKEKEQDLTKDILLSYKKEELTLNTLYTICDNYDINIFNLSTILINSSDIIKTQPILIEIAAVLNKLLPNSNYRNEQEQDYQIAKAILGLHTKNPKLSETSWSKKVKCPRSLYIISRNILLNKNHKYINILEQARKEKQQEIGKMIGEKLVKNRNEKRNDALEEITNLSNEELYNFLKNAGRDSFQITQFFMAFNLPVDPSYAISVIDHNFLSELIKNKEKAEEIYAKYKTAYQNIIKETAAKMALAQKENYNFTFDLYEYYKKYTIKIGEVFGLTKKLGLYNERDIIGKYIFKHQEMFRYMDNTHMSMLATNNKIVLGKEEISYNPNDFSLAIEDINKNGMPLYKGVVYGAIKRQVDERTRKEQEKKQKEAQQMKLEYYFIAINKCNNKEELLLTYFKGLKIAKNTQEEKNLTKEFNKQFDIIERNKALSNSNEIIGKVLESFQNNKIKIKLIREICEEYDISIYSLINSLYLKTKDQKLEPCTKKNLQIIDNNLIKYLNHIKDQEDDERDYQIAKATINLYLNSDATNKSEFKNKTDCPLKFYKKAMEKLKLRNNSLYQKTKDKENNGDDFNGVASSTITSKNSSNSSNSSKIYKKVNKN